MFTGDSIIGGKSTFFEDYVEYFGTLLKTKKLVHDLNVQKFFVAHSNSLYPKDIVLDAKAKVQSYIDRRTRKDKQLENIADHLAQKMGAFTTEDFYKAQMNQKVKKNPKKGQTFNSKLDDYFMKMLDRQILKLVSDGKYKVTNV